MHVDGFRFDLASALARELHAVDKLGAFFDIIHQDPVLSQVKLIAEPWDLGEGGYQVGNFPVAVDGVERQVSRHGAALLARRRRRRRRSSRRASPAAAISTSRAAAVRTRASTSSPRTTGSRSRISSATTRSTTRRTARTTRDGENHNLSWNCGVEGRDRRSPGARAARAAAAQPDGDAAALGRRADDQRRRRDGPHAARQQQRVLPGQRDQLDDLGPDARAAGVPRVHAPRDPLLAGPAGAAAPQVLPGPLDSRRRSRRTSPGSTRRAPR